MKAAFLRPSSRPLSQIFPRLLRRPSLLAFLIIGCSAGSVDRTEGPLAADTAADIPIAGQAWREAKRELESLRESFAPTAGMMRVAIRFRVGEAFRVRGRGAVARRPPNDLRMILVGPGGTTAFDLLLRDQDWRLQLAKGDVLRGNATSSEKKGLPVSFLRWWLLRPLTGRLLAVRTTAKGTVFFLRDGEATVRVLRQGTGLVMDRKSPSGVERMSVTGPGCADAVYQHMDTGVRAEVRCEAVTGGPDATASRMFE